VNDRLANTCRQQHDRQPIQCNASDAACGNRHHHGRVERQILQAVGVGAHGAPVPIAALRLVGAKILDLGAADEIPLQR